jgi:hypothetical protein
MGHSLTALYLSTDILSIRLYIWARMIPPMSMPGAHRVASLLKRWLLGTHQGSVQPQQLDYYLDELTFRFNRRTSRSRGVLFYRLIEQATAIAPVPYGTVVGPKD